MGLLQHQKKKFATYECNAPLYFQSKNSHFYFEKKIGCSILLIQLLFMYFCSFLPTKLISYRGAEIKSDLNNNYFHPHLKQTVSPVQIYMQCIFTLSTTGSSISSTSHIVHPPEKLTVCHCHHPQSQCAQHLMRVCFGPLSLMQFNVVSFALESQLPLPWWHAKKKNISQQLVIASLQPRLKFFFPALFFCFSFFFCRNLGWEISRPWLHQRMSSPASNYPTRISSCYTLYKEFWFPSIQTTGTSVHSRLRRASWWVNRSRVWHKGSWVSFMGRNWSFKMSYFIHQMELSSITVNVSGRF